MKTHTAKHGNVLDGVRPLTDQHEKEIQPYGTIVRLPIGRKAADWVRRESMQDQHRESQSTSRRYHDPRAVYKKHHWQVAGPTLAERIQVLGGISVARAPDIAETTQIPRFTRGSGGLQTTALGRAEWRRVRRARRLPIKHAATGAHCIRQRALDKPGIINARMASADGSIKTFPLRGTLGGDLNGERLLPLLSLKGEQRHDEDIHGCLCGIAPLRRNNLG